MAEFNFLEACKGFTNVSHETLDRLKAYADLIAQWQPRINLISPATLPDLWQRHIFDSAQLLTYINADDRLVDLGSGGGFPGMVLAIMSPAPVTLIESDQRKCAFLQEAARVTQTPVTILNKRVEDAAKQITASLVTARAFAPLPKLLGLTAPWLTKGARGLFLKGQNLAEELHDANAAWTLTTRTYPSLSDPAASILIVESLSPR